MNRDTEIIEGRKYQMWGTVGLWVVGIVFALKVVGIIKPWDVVGGVAFMVGIPSLISYIAGKIKVKAAS